MRNAVHEAWVDAMKARLTKKFLCRGCEPLRTRKAKIVEDSDRPWLRHYDRGVGHDLAQPQALLTSLFLDAARDWGTATAFIYFERSFTYTEVYRLVMRFSAGLRSIGVTRENHVALILPNCPQFIIAYWAILWLGARVVPMNPLLSEREMRTQLKLSNAQAAITLDRVLPRLYRIYRNTGLRSIVVASLETFMPTLDKIGYRLKTRSWLNQPRVQKDRSVHLFRELLIDEAGPPSAGEIDPDSPAVQLFTAGVTGSPKLAVLSHRNLLANAYQARIWIPGFRDGKKTILAALPLLHSYGLTVCHHLAWYSKAAVLLEPRFDARRLARLSRRYSIDLFPAVPTMFVALLANKKADFYAQICISGGSPLPEPVRTEFRSRFGIDITQGYGLTEAGPITIAIRSKGGTSPTASACPGRARVRGSSIYRAVCLCRPVKSASCKSQDRRLCQATTAIQRKPEMFFHRLPGSAPVMWREWMRMDIFLLLIAKKILSLRAVIMSILRK
jgi:long-chain acyl-CoA synthetase